MIKAAAFNRELGLKINRDIWNGRQFDRIPEYFAEDFTSEYSPSLVRQGRQHIQPAVERSHAAFEGFREEIQGRPPGGRDRQPHRATTDRRDTWP